MSHTLLPCPSKATRLCNKELIKCPRKLENLDVITTVFHQGDNRWTTEHSHDEDDEVEDDEDENDEDEVVADDDVDEQKDLGQSSGRVRRSAESATARPRKKRKERKSKYTTLLA